MGGRQSWGTHVTAWRAPSARALCPGAADDQGSMMGCQWAAKEHRPSSPHHRGLEHSSGDPPGLAAAQDPGARAAPLQALATCRVGLVHCQDAAAGGRDLVLHAGVAEQRGGAWMAAMRRDRPQPQGADCAAPRAHGTTLGWRRCRVAGRRQSRGYFCSRGCPRRRGGTPRLGSSRGDGPRDPGAVATPQDVLQHLPRSVPAHPRTWTRRTRGRSGRGRPARHGGRSSAQGP